MSIPAEIRAVPRPKNSIVYAYGKNKDRYAVKQRIGCVRKNGRNCPVDGPTIGHIVDGQFIPLEVQSVQPVHTSEVTLKDWANVKPCYEQCSELRDELLQVYNRKDTEKFCVRRSSVSAIPISKTQNSKSITMIPICLNCSPELL